MEEKNIYIFYVAQFYLCDTMRIDPGGGRSCYNNPATMPQTHNIQHNDRIMNEHDLPISVYQLIDDVSVNGAVVVLRENRPSIRITPEPEMDSEQEKILFQEAMSVATQPDAQWFDSVDEFITDLESGDAR